MCGFDSAVWLPTTTRQPVLESSRYFAEGRRKDDLQSV